MIKKLKDNKAIIPTAYAQTKYIRLSPHKVRRVLNQIRGKEYSEALTVLEFMPYRPCKKIQNILKSAAANAINQYGYSKNKLMIVEAIANAGPTLKRFQPRAQGRAFKIRKPTCHITLTVMSRN